MNHINSQGVIFKKNCRIFKKNNYRIIIMSTIINFDYKVQIFTNVKVIYIYNKKKIYKKDSSIE